jgi:hypothetical protein
LWRGGSQLSPDSGSAPASPTAVLAERRALRGIVREGFGVRWQHVLRRPRVGDRVTGDGHYLLEERARRAVVGPFRVAYVDPPSALRDELGSPRSFKESIGVCDHREPNEWDERRQFGGDPIGVRREEKSVVVGAENVEESV